MTLQRRRGVDHEWYANQFVQQNGLCAICGTDKPGGNADSEGNTAFAIDHNHDTGEIRALLCRSCNVGLGNFGDNPDRLLAAASYLLQFTDVAWAEL
jgi:hypothetical protein